MRCMYFGSETEKGEKGVGVKIHLYDYSRADFYWNWLAITWYPIKWIRTGDTSFIPWKGG